MSERNEQTQTVLCSKGHAHHAAFKSNDAMNTKPCLFSKGLFITFANSGILFLCLVAICKHESPKDVLRVEASWSELVQVARTSHECPSNGGAVGLRTKMCLEAPRSNSMVVGVFKAYQASAHVVKIFLAECALWICWWHWLLLMKK